MNIQSAHRFIHNGIAYIYSAALACARAAAIGLLHLPPVILTTLMFIDHLLWFFGYVPSHFVFHHLRPYIGGDLFLAIFPLFSLMYAVAISASAVIAWLKRYTGDNTIIVGFTTSLHLTNLMMSFTVSMLYVTQLLYLHGIRSSREALGNTIFWLSFDYSPDINVVFVAMAVTFFSLVISLMVLFAYLFHEMPIDGPFMRALDFAWYLGALASVILAAFDVYEQSNRNEFNARFEEIGRSKDLITLHCDVERSIYCDEVSRAVRFDPDVLRIVIVSLASYGENVEDLDEIKEVREVIDHLKEEVGERRSYVLDELQRMYEEMVAALEAPTRAGGSAALLLSAAALVLVLAIRLSRTLLEVIQALERGARRPE